MVEKKYAIAYPFSAEWCYERNGELRPENVMAGSDRKVWWKCSKCGHEWQARVSCRKRGRGCPVCAGRVVVKGKNDLASVNPKLSAEWNFEKNGGLHPVNVTAGSNKKVWWKCSKCGHEWQAAVKDQGKRNGCSVCSCDKKYKPRKHGILVNSIPELLKEWNLEKNDELRPELVAAGSNKKVWWKCSKCGHEWQAQVNSRTQGHGCPVCAGRVVVKGKNDLVTVNPKLSAEWNFEKNDELRPEDVTAGSGKKVWWKCSKCGYEWQRRVSSQARLKSCPVCVKFTAVREGKCLAVVDPKLSTEWNFEKNGELRPENVTAGTHRKVWWKCSKCGHEWQAQVNSRTQGHGCPVCAGRVVVKGKNDLVTVNPKLSAEWNFEKNGELRPEDVTAGSNKKVWWKCSKCGHEWQAQVSSRTRGHGCPVCAGRSAVKGKNDLVTVNPKLSAVWNFEKNGELRPENVTAGTHRKVWWKCSKCGHEWQRRVFNQVKMGSCPQCVRKAKRDGYNVKEKGSD